MMTEPIFSPPLECPCDGRCFELAHRYTEPPAGEIRFAFNAANGYRRDLLRCRTCSHVVSRHTMDTSGMYSGEYVNATYGDADGLRRNFERIIALDPARSDNTARVQRVLDFSKAHFGPGSRSILDVGSGLCVFLYRMKEAGWDCTALDPDSRQAAHARETAGVKAICGDFMQLSEPLRVDVISFNKVLEHVEGPVAMLRKSTEFLNPAGFVYIELPDAEGAKTDGFGREEFFIDHLHVFSATSLCALVERAGLTLLALERVREPSSKFTLRGFATLSKARKHDSDN